MNINTGPAKNHQTLKLSILGFHFWFKQKQRLELSSKKTQSSIQHRPLKHSFHISQTSRHSMVKFLTVMDHNS